MDRRKFLKDAAKVGAVASVVPLLPTKKVEQPNLSTFIDGEGKTNFKIEVKEEPIFKVIAIQKDTAYTTTCARFSDSHAAKTYIKMMEALEDKYGGRISEYHIIKCLPSDVDKVFLNQDIV